MRAICLWQPFASLVASGLKSIETRTWSTDYRGEFVVCATKGAAPKTLYAHTLNRMRALGHPTDGYEYGVAPRGVTLCVANLIDCRPMTLADVPDAFVDPMLIRLTHQTEMEDLTCSI